ncbi:putative peroxidase [Cladorrhinum samala]|uniref:Peroxidase n=1 Tax=Cladorrhinum samala TaxID=585594 RepID=A0AAV9HRR2_9PEZI|nr:putative peroxidase [Cladorrhinum samala]
MSQPQESTSSLARGEYSKSCKSDLRGPCPMINTLANHGYLPRDGRSLHAGEVYSALNEAGLSPALRAVFSNPIFLEHHGQQKQQSMPLLSKTWFFVRNPWAIFFSKFGMRNPGQFDSKGKPVINIDQIAAEGAVEHDISLSRFDRAQGDCLTPQPELVDDLVASSSDGGQTLTAEDLAALRLRRIEKQKRDNPELLYGPEQHRLSCAEIALILCVFGDGFKVPVEYVKAFFVDERLPIQEGWKKRGWWSTLGFRELGSTARRVADLVGYKFE